MARQMGALNAIDHSPKKVRGVGFKRARFEKENPKAFEGLKSWRLFQREYGGVAGSYVEMWECKSLEELDKVNARMMKHKEMMEIDTEFHKLIEHTTFTEPIWNPVA